MCGIAGVYSLSEKGKLAASYLPNSLDKLNKRGPDYQNIYSEKNVTLGHARLSIIDTSSLANQPFTSNCGRYTIVFNGEIFNFKALKAGLSSKNIHFKSESDTEVLLNLYIHFGKSCVQQLNGFFSFVIYDKELEQLFMARDRYGIKPFLYYLSPDLFCFASEMKALLEFKIPKRLNKSAMMQYFHLNYIAGTHSIFEGVNKLEPGCMAFFDKSGLKIERYYQIESNTEKAKLSTDFNENCSHLYKLLDDSVQLRMISDVPLGCFLSGGIDSSVITALAAKHTSKLNTFSIGFKDEPLFDETKYAKLVAQKCNTNHTVFSLSNNDLYDNLHNVLDYIDEPFADSSALNVFILSQQTRKKVTVALSGDGADEMFAGYNKHAAAYAILNNTYKINQLKFAEPLLSILPKSRNSKLGNMARQLHKLAEGAKLNHKDRYWQWAGFYRENELQDLFVPEFLNASIVETYTTDKAILLSAFDRNDLESIQPILLSDMKMVLAGDMLTKVDLMSMANSLEVRVPFLDYRVVDFAFSLPDSHKINASNRKIILKEAFKKELPEELFHRGKKGFEVPLLKWFKTDLRGMITDDLLAQRFIEEQNIFNYRTIKKLINQLFSNNPGDSVAKIWALLVFQYWYKKYYI